MLLLLALTIPWAVFMLLFCFKREYFTVLVYAVFVCPYALVASVLCVSNISSFCLRFHLLVDVVILAVALAASVTGCELVSKNEYDIVIKNENRRLSRYT